MNITTLGIDLAKNIFQLHGADSKGKAVLKKRFSREQLSAFAANLPSCKIVMEACGSANYWARKFMSQGHEVKLISPQFVKPFVKSNKNDRNDAQAIVEASSRPSMRYVTPKTVEQQDMQSLLRLRDACMQMRTKLGNQLRGLLAEYGVVIPQGMSRLRKQLAALLGGLDEPAEGEVTDYLRELLFIPYELLQKIESQITEYDKKIAQVAKANQACQRIQQIEGVGLVTAIAIVSTMGSPNDFKNGRHFAAFLGLVPKQSSSGSRQRLLGISKRGDNYTRQVLIHGARSVVNYASKKSDKRSVWVNRLKQRAGTNRTCVALANKNARIIWALLKYPENYRKQAA
jgi:transposase